MTRFRVSQVISLTRILIDEIFDFNHFFDSTTIIRLIICVYYTEFIRNLKCLLKISLYVIMLAIWRISAYKNDSYYGNRYIPLMMILRIAI